MKADTDTRYTVGDQPLEGVAAVNRHISVSKLNTFGMTLCKLCNKVVAVDFHNCSTGISQKEYQEAIEERWL